MRKVMIVVPVLMTSCQVSLNWNSGPVVAHTTTIRIAPRKTVAEPAQVDTRPATIRNTFFINLVWHKHDQGKYLHFKIEMLQ